jgi:hypothetical protein
MTAEEEALRQLARQLIADGKLPATTILDQVEGGLGHDKQCSLCGKPITREQYQYRMFRTAVEQRQFWLHGNGCHAAWQFEAAQVALQHRAPVSH